MSRLLTVRRSIAAAAAALAVAGAVVFTPTAPSSSGPSDAPSRDQGFAVPAPTPALSPEEPEPAAKGPFHTQLLAARAVWTAVVTESFGPGRGQDLLIPSHDLVGPFVARDGATGALLWRYRTDEIFVGRADSMGDRLEELLFAEIHACGRAGGTTGVTFSVVAPRTGTLLWRNEIRLRRCPADSLEEWRQDLGWAGDLTGDGAADVVVARDRERRSIIILDGRSGARTAAVSWEQSSLAVIPHPTVRGRSLVLAFTSGPDERMRAVLLDASGRRVWRSETMPTAAMDPVAVTALNAGAARDLVLSAADHTVALDGESGAILWRAEEHIVGSFALVLRPLLRFAGDVDGDGRADLLFSRAAKRNLPVTSVGGDPAAIGVITGGSGTVLWEKSVARHGTAEATAFLVPSLSGDGRLDVIERHAQWEDEEGSLLALVAVDGRSGTQLWETSGRDLIGAESSAGADANGDAIPDLWGFTEDGGGFYSWGEGYANRAFRIELASGRDLSRLSDFQGSDSSTESVTLEPIDVDADGRDELFVRIEGPDGALEAFVRGIDGPVWRARSGPAFGR